MTLFTLKQEHQNHFEGSMSSNRVNAVSSHFMPRSPLSALCHSVAEQVGSGVQAA